MKRLKRSTEQGVWCGLVPHGNGQAMAAAPVEDPDRKRSGRAGRKDAGRRGETQGREQTTLFLSLFILALGILFLTRDREELLKEEIVTLLGIVLNVSLAVEFSLREKWTFAVFAMLIAVAAGLVLGTQLFA